MARAPGAGPAGVARSPRAGPTRVSSATGPAAASASPRARPAAASATGGASVPVSGRPGSARRSSVAFVGAAVGPGAWSRTDVAAVAAGQKQQQSRTRQRTCRPMRAERHDGSNDTIACVAGARHALPGDFGDLSYELRGAPRRTAGRRSPRQWGRRAAAAARARCPAERP